MIHQAIRPLVYSQQHAQSRHVVVVHQKGVQDGVVRNLQVTIRKASSTRMLISSAGVFCIRRPNATFSKQSYVGKARNFEKPYLQNVVPLGYP